MKQMQKQDEGDLHPVSMLRLVESSFLPFNIKVAVRARLSPAKRGVGWTLLLSLEVLL